MLVLFLSNFLNSHYVALNSIDECMWWFEDFFVGCRPFRCRICDDDIGSVSPRISYFGIALGLGGTGEVKGDAGNRPAGGGAPEEVSTTGIAVADLEGAQFLRGRNLGKMNWNWHLLQMPPWNFCRKYILVHDSLSHSQALASAGDVFVLDNRKAAELDEMATDICSAFVHKDEWQESATRVLSG